MTQAVVQPSLETLPVNQIRRDGGTQPRSRLNEDVVAEYAEDMQQGKVFPPPVVFYDGQDYWLADGFHRVKAAEQAGLDNIAVDLHHGTRRDAVLHSVGANADHGLRRTGADKRRAVIRLLGDPEWSQWSNVEIGRQCAVSESFVRAVKGEISSLTPKIETFDTNQKFGVDQHTLQQAKQRLEKRPEARYAQRGGTVYKINTTNIGRGSTSTHSEPVSSSSKADSVAKSFAPLTAEPAALSSTLPSSSAEKIAPPLQIAPVTPLQTAPGQRQRAATPARSEILSIQRQDKTIVVTPRKVQSGTIWKLGDSQLLYCGSITDVQFQKLLPQPVELVLTVASHPQPWFGQSPIKAVSELTFISPYSGDRDLRLFRELVQNAIDFYTDPGDSVVLATLPDPSLFILMDELEAHCICAEPDPRRCEEALVAWSATGKPVERR